MSKSESTASRVLTDNKTVTIQYKPVTNLAGSKNVLQVTCSHMATFNYHMHYPIFMACTDAAVISMTMYLDTV